jgi:hypothetical protein
MATAPMISMRLTSAARMALALTPQQTQVLTISPLAADIAGTD